MTKTGASKKSICDAAQDEVHSGYPEPFRDCWIRLTDTVRTAPVLGECSQCGKREICKPCVAMLYAETGEVNRRAPYLCRFSDCLITEMKKEINES